jgi:hypothetical protein
VHAAPPHPVLRHAPLHHRAHLYDALVEWSTAGRRSPPAAPPNGGAVGLAGARPATFRTAVGPGGMAPAWTACPMSPVGDRSIRGATGFGDAGKACHVGCETVSRPTNSRECAVTLARSGVRRPEHDRVRDVDGGSVRRLRKLDPLDHVRDTSIDSGEAAAPRAIDVTRRQDPKLRRHGAFDARSRAQLF